MSARFVISSDGKDNIIDKHHVGDFKALYVERRDLFSIEKVI